jgi:peptide/nickel transport system substrate-binding protein
MRRSVGVRGLKGSLFWALLVCTAIIMAACGGGNKSNQSNNQPSSAVPKSGGSATYLAAADVDSLDPGKTFYAFAYMVQYAVNRPLYNYKPPDFENPYPDLAAAAPTISKDEKTLTIPIKHGIMFSPPVSREVTAADVKYAIERAFTANVANPYASEYFGDIKGAPKTKGKFTPISGLKTEGKYKLVIELTQPTAIRMSHALVMPITIPVPQEYASKFDSKTPSTYGFHVVFTGPYMVKNNSAGDLTGYKPSQEIALIRNPNWNRSTDYRPAYLNSITINEGNSDLTLAGNRTLEGDSQMCCDISQPPPSVLSLAHNKYPTQMMSLPAGSTKWVALTTSIPPFNNLNVRKAVFAIFNRELLRKTRGGPAAGPIASAFIPPGVSGFNQSGGKQGFGDLDFTQHLQGDPALAKKYMLAARAQGVKNINANGIYTGPAIQGIAANAHPSKNTALSAQHEFAKLGFKIKLGYFTQTTVYHKCGIPQRMLADKVGTCISVGWFRDFNDPQAVLQPTFSGDAIQKQGNVNWSLLDNSTVNKEMTSAALLPGQKRAAAWTKVNHDVTALAPAIPFLWDLSYQFASKNLNINPNIDGKEISAMNGYYSTWDLSYVSQR